MAFSSTVGILIPLYDELSSEAIFEAVDSISEYSKANDFGTNEYETTVETKWLFFKKTKENKKYVSITRDNNDFNQIAKKKLKTDGYISLWNLPNSMNSLLLDGSAEKENVQLRHRNPLELNLKRMASRSI